MEHIEQHENTPTLYDLYSSLIDNEPKLITNYVPSVESAQPQKADFLSDAIRNPDHEYDKLDALDLNSMQAQTKELRHMILEHAEIGKYRPVYEEFLDGYNKKTHLMSLARSFNHADDEVEKATIKQEYMQLNIELYGAPVETTYRSIMQEKLSRIDQKELTGQAQRIRDELFQALDYAPSSERIERFLPSDDTVEWMHDVAESLYGNMLAHIPDKKTFSAEDVRSVFTEIINEEFGDAAADWKVDIEAATSINVKSTEKRIVIPENRAEMSHQALRGLVVHEIGVHMMRAVTGAETDLFPLQNGLSDYYDAEEGLGVVMEQALKSKFSESGIDHYITAGLAYHDSKDFRGAFEVKWRLSALAAATESGEVTDESITKAKNTAYGSVMRSMRGTDELPWFKDLAYYNGSIDVWRHLENIKGDDLKFMFVLLGKANPANSAHEQILLETKSTN